MDQRGEGLKLADGGGLSLVRLRSGSCTWQIKYRGGTTEKTFSIGPFEEVSLAQARDARSTIRGLLKEGKDPVQARRMERAAEIASSGATFRDVARSWLAKEKPGWSKIHYDKSKRAIERDVLPALGKLPVRDITPAVVAEVIEAIQRLGVRDTAARTYQHVRSIFRYAAAKGYRPDNPADPVVEMLRKPDTVKHRPALLSFV